MSKTKKPAAKKTPAQLEQAGMAHYVSDWIIDWRARLEKMDRIAADMHADIEANPDGPLARYITREQLLELRTGLDKCCNVIGNIVPPIHNEYVANPLELLQQAREANG